MELTQESSHKKNCITPNPIKGAIYPIDRPLHDDEISSIARKVAKSDSLSGNNLSQSAGSQSFIVGKKENKH